MDRIAVGFCSNLALCGFAGLRGDEGGTVTAGCESLFDDIVARDVSMARFAALLTNNRKSRRTTVPVRSFAADVDDWTLVLPPPPQNGEDDAESRTLEVLGVDEDVTVLVPPTPYLRRARPLRPTAEITGCAGMLLRAARVTAVYPLLQSPVQALFLCVGAGALDGTEALDSLRGSSNATLRGSLVYCMVDCPPSERWKLCGLPNDVLQSVYNGMLRNGMLESVANASAADVVVWQLLRYILPLVHLDVCPSLRAWVKQRRLRAAIM